MAFKFVVLSAFLAVANAGLLGAPAAVGYGAVGYGAPLGYAASAYAPSAYAHGISSPALVSQQNNILRTPGNLGQVSTYSKTINTPYSSVSKSDVRVSNDALAYGAVGHGIGYAAPALGYGGYAAPALAHGYASPALGYASPALGYASPLGARVAAPLGVAAHGGLLGVAYSAAPAVAHISYSNGYGINYAY